MRVIKVANKEELGKVGAAFIAARMQAKTHFVLGLATGSTPEPVYAELARLHKDEKLDFSTTTTFNLDEYIGLEPTHDQSYRYFMNKKLFSLVNINLAGTHVPDGMAEDIEVHCLEYEMTIEDCGGIDVQVLGIGRNGHLAFNEPGSSLASRTRALSLTQDTIEANSRMFERIEDVPTRAVTMGLGTILEADTQLFLASGENKIAAVKAALEGPVTVACPASVLQLHPDVTCIITEDAASGLTLNFE
ncbi:glucosamine-6-phosphate deaminase [Planctomycetota bacterium]